MAAGASDGDGRVTATTTPAARAVELDAALEAIAAGAERLDAEPRFPELAMRALADADALGAELPREAVPDPPPSRAREWDLVRAVARADGSVGRIFDGHLNAVERVAALAPEPLRSRELEGVASGELWLGTWGADPRPGEGEPARLDREGPGAESRLRGVKTFCSGAGGLQRALVLARGPDRAGPPRLAYVDLADGVEVDRSWYRGMGLRASESHRVVFHDARVLAVLGEPGELSREPLFSRDALRTAASWAGMADTAVEAALDGLAGRGAPTQLEALAAGRIRIAATAIDLWLSEAARRADADPAAGMASFSIQAREAIAAACRAILDEAARALGSTPFARSGPLDRARRDLELFLLQHRLDPLVAREGARLVEERA